MPDILDFSGLRVKSYSEIRQELEDGFHSIFGTELNLNSNTQDGQMINLFAQSGTDMRELILNAFANLFLDDAQGVALDRAASNVNAKRRIGTRARVTLTLTFNRTVVLTGEDNDRSKPGVFTVRDNKNNNYRLESSETFSPGEASAIFIAENSGMLDIQPQSITNISTIIAGVTSVINNHEPISYGSDHENDTSFRARVKLGDSASRDRGSDELIRAAIMEIDGVSDAIVIEESGGINALVKGGRREDIARALFYSRAAGVYLSGSESVFYRSREIRFDFAEQQILYYRITLRDKNSLNSAIEEKYIRNMLLGYEFGIGNTAEQILLADMIKDRFPNLLISNSFLSVDGNNWFDNVNPDARKYFAITDNSLTITIGN